MIKTTFCSRCGESEDISVGSDDGDDDDVGRCLDERISMISTKNGGDDVVMVVVLSEDCSYHLD
jgi:hypothetical protein